MCGIVDAALLCAYIHINDILFILGKKHSVIYSLL